MNNEIKSAEGLEVFKIAHKLTIKIYEITNYFPEYEKYGITSQLRRSASSIGANLMEGSHRINKKEFKQFVGIARGSAGELKYFLRLSKDIGYITKENYNFLIKETDKISKMLYNLIKSLTYIHPHSHSHQKEEQ
ncbi:four helix bundle protein [Nitrosophilus labii]|uniref:four helix bundle protein n=1 Tax=Nitrosophilus labii TaxID=2706014 RepID=UPI001656C7CA|nr:four helix bundle protein [Nitrosophilus labii]